MRGTQEERGREEGGRVGGKEEGGREGMEIAFLTVLPLSYRNLTASPI